jgi:hypothetical protein
MNTDNSFNDFTGDMEMLENEFVALAMQIHTSLQQNNLTASLDLLQSIGVPAKEAQLMIESLSAHVEINKNELARAWQQILTVSKQRIEQGKRDIAKSHKNFFTALGLQSGWPKNRLYWYLMKHTLGAQDFDFEIPASSRHALHENVIYFKSRVSDQLGFLPFALAACGLGGGLGSIPAHIIRKSEYILDQLGEERGIELLHCIINAKIIFPPRRIVHYLVEAIKRGLTGEIVLLTGVLCPDYSYEQTGDVNSPFRYTFNSVGVGVGLVARQSLRILRAIVDLFAQWGISYQIKFAIADFEANVADTLKRVNVDHDEFISRCRSSLAAFQQSLGNIPMELLLFEQEWANGRWQRKLKEMRVQMLSHDFGLVREYTDKDPKREIEFILERDLHFYQRWHERSQQAENPETVVIDQIAERATIGHVISHDHVKQPLIMLSGSMPKKELFNFVDPAKSFPILCAQRLY